LNEQLCSRFLQLEIPEKIKIFFVKMPFTNFLISLANKRVKKIIFCSQQKVACFVQLFQNRKLFISSEESFVLRKHTEIMFFLLLIGFGIRLARKLVN
jgi:hypothetical protein